MTHEMLLPCKLSVDEKQARAEELASKVREVEEIEAERKEVMADYKGKLDPLKEDISSLAGTVNRGTEERMIEIDERLVDPATPDGYVSVFRTDTGEEVQRRDITEGDKQGNLPTG